MRFGLIAAGLALGLAGPAAAQAPAFKPIDTTKFVINPADSTANASAFSIRFLGRTVADTIENNGIVRTLNNLLGRKATPAGTQAGFSPYPLPSSFPSTKYPSAIKPTLPAMSTFGRTPVIPK